MTNLPQQRCVLPVKKARTTRFILFAVVILCGWLTPGHPGSTVAAAPKPPNVVLILVDDLGWADVGCNGSQFYRTPNIDKLAREGVRFTQAYAAAPVCTPTRASILTGRHPARLHLTDWLPGRGDRPDQKLKRPAIANSLPLEEITLAEMLKPAGYHTAHIGKWHLGGEGFSPKEQGFELNIAGDHTGTPLSYLAPFRKGEAKMPGLESAKAGEYLTDRLTTEALKFMEANRRSPFFLYFAHYAVHTPLTAKNNLVAKYQGPAKTGGTQTNAIYAAMIESVDESVGKLMRKLDDLGLAKDTIVIFTSDNGGLSTPEGPNTPATSNAPLRAGKGHLYEGGIRVPLVIRYPKSMPAATVETTPVSSLDLLPTLAELTDATPPTVVLDGRSLVSLWTKTEPATTRPLFWHYPHYSNQGGHPAGAVREGELKLVEHYESGYLELFDLQKDPSETTNLAGQQPQKANELQKKLADWRKSVGAQMTTPNPDYVAVPIAQAPDGAITLPAHEVTIHGVNVRYEPPAHKNTIGYWTKPEDWVSWELEVSRPGVFEVEVLQGCGKGSGGSEVEISAGDQSLRFTVQDTGHFQNFVPRTLGQFNLSRAGRYTLAVKPVTKPGVAVMDLRQIILKPKTSP